MSGPASDNATDPSAMLGWTVAKTVLNENDKARLACVFFHTDAAKIDWDSAAKDFGSASTGSFRTMVNQSHRKVKDAMIKVANGELEIEISTPSTKLKGGRKGKAVGSDNGADVEVETPTKKKGGGRKRKVVESDGGVDSEIEKTPVKKRTPRAKKPAAMAKPIAVKAEVSAEEENGDVVNEEAGEGSAADEDTADVDSVGANAGSSDAGMFSIKEENEDL